MNKPKPAYSAVRGLVKASFNCFLSKLDRSRVARSRASLSVATTRSCPVKNHAVLQSRGITPMKTAPAPTVRPPQTRNIMRQFSSATLAPPSPYIIRAPTICETPNMDTHALCSSMTVCNFSESDAWTYAMRTGCSLRLYQALVMIMKDGDTAPSVNPSRKRTAPMPAKL